MLEQLSVMSPLLLYYVALIFLLHGYIFDIIKFTFYLIFYLIHLSKTRSTQFDNLLTLNW